MHPVQYTVATEEQRKLKLNIVKANVTTNVVNSHLVCDRTIRQPGFDLPRQQWSLLNCFCTEGGH